MEFSAAAERCCTSPPTSERAGRRISRGPAATWPSAMRRETIDAASCNTHETLPSPFLARPPRMVRRRGLRELLAIARGPWRVLPHSEPDGVLLGAAQSPLCSPQPLLLKF